MNPPKKPRRMTPGCVILYRGSRADVPLWPSIYLTEEATPKSFLDTRPHGFYSIVLKLAAVLDTKNLRWAQTSQMIPFDPSVADEATKRSTPGLQNAYKLAHEAEECSYDLDYWQAMLASTQPEVINIDSDGDDWSNDPEMLQAIRLSLLEDTSQKPQQQPTKYTGAQVGLRNIKPYPSFPKTKGFGLHSTDSRPSSLNSGACRDPDSAAPAPSPSRTYTDSRQIHPFAKRLNPPSPSASPNKSALLPQEEKPMGQFAGFRSSESLRIPSQRSHGLPSPAYGISSKDTQQLSTSSHGPPQALPISRTVARPGLDAKQIFQQHRLNVLASVAPDRDIIEENLDESSQFVQVFVGPEVDPASNSDIDPERRRYRLQLLKHHVWDRRYFRDTVSARHCFKPIGENTWELVHPRLVDILPADFRWAAEFLSDGDFGHRDPDNEDQVAETFAQCMSAWKTAEILNMDDLLEHVVKKIRAAQPWWDLWNVMAFACSVYQSDISLQSHDDLKDMFSEYIADLFFVYLEDNYLSGTFLTRLKQLPELERDVLTKRVAQLEARSQPQQNSGVVLLQADDRTSDEGSQDMDLYAAS